MALRKNYTKKSGKFEQCPEGVYLARCYAVYDIGHQEVKFNEKIKIVPKFIVVWELNEMMSDGRPFSVSKMYNNSLHEKSMLRKDVEAWFGKKLGEEDLILFDPQKLIGKPCQIQVTHSTVATPSGEKTYTNVTALMSVPKSMTVPPLVNPTIVYNIEDQVPEGTPEWIEKMIMKSKEKSSGEEWSEEDMSTENEPF